ncbi:MAG TPA: hydrogenase subunit MbhD domain-containing protein, partial [Magnetospirillaceae bacterium]|nr:hydrogenase subunit MbhD domain-containing protein [Magnetospirillaceae bacterium]
TMAETPRGRRPQVIVSVIALMLVVSALSMLTRDLLAMTILLAVFSLLCSVVFYYLHAPDVAITEAAVGAGVSTLILVWAVRRTSRKEEG